MADDICLNHSGIALVYSSNTVKRTFYNVGILKNLCVPTVHPNLPSFESQSSHKAVPP